MIRTTQRVNPSLPAGVTLTVTDRLPGGLVRARSDGALLLLHPNQYEAA